MLARADGERAAVRPRRRRATLSWAESAAFSKRKAEEPAYRQQIAEAIRALTGSSLRLAYELATTPSRRHPAPARSRRTS